MAKRKTGREADGAAQIAEGDTGAPVPDDAAPGNFPPACAAAEAAAPALDKAEFAAIFDEAVAMIRRGFDLSGDPHLGAWLARAEPYAAWWRAAGAPAEQQQDQA